MSEVKYETQTVKSGKYKIIATQRVREGRLEGGYVYSINIGKHILSTGSMSCFAFEKGLPDGELLKVLENYIARN